MEEEARNCWTRRYSAQRLAPPSSRQRGHGVGVVVSYLINHTHDMSLEATLHLMVAIQHSHLWTAQLSGYHILCPSLADN